MVVRPRRAQGRAQTIRKLQGSQGMQGRCCRTAAPFCLCLLPAAVVDHPVEQAGACLAKQSLILVGTLVHGAARPPGCGQQLQLRQRFQQLGQTGPCDAAWGGWLRWGMEREGWWRGRQVGQMRMGLKATTTLPRTTDGIDHQPAQLVQAGQALDQLSVAHEVGAPAHTGAQPPHCEDIWGPGVDI